MPFVPAPREPDRPVRQLARRTGIALLVAWLVNWMVIVVIIRFERIAPAVPLEFAPVTGWTTVAIACAAVGYAIIDRYSTDPDAVFLQFVIVLLVLSFVPPLSGLVTDPEVTGGTVAVSILMHVIVAASCALVLSDHRLPVGP